MVHSAVDRLKQLLKGRWLAVVVTAILVYFGYHALHGRLGLLAWIDRSRELEAARQELAGLTAERERFERQVRAFKEDNIDRDLLEEELRKLGYIQRQEVIILPPSGG